MKASLVARRTLSPPRPGIKLGAGQRGNRPAVPALQLAMSADPHPTRQLPYGPLTERTAHLCIDMQTLFAERTDWHLPWLERVLPVVVRIARAQPERTVFTRFVPPEKPEDMAGTWRRYYEHWRKMTRKELDPALIELVPALARLVPPATVIDKRHYSPFTEPRLLKLLRERNVDAIVITGAETDVCVLATVIGAVDLGFRVVLARDALCSASDRTHDALLTLYTERFGQQIEVAPAEVILAAWT
jgi:nicotinamidase-related amidase